MIKLLPGEKLIARDKDKTIVMDSNSIKNIQNKNEAKSSEGNANYELDNGLNQNSNMNSPNFTNFPNIINPNASGLGGMNYPTGNPQGFLNQPLQNNRILSPRQVMNTASNMISQNQKGLYPKFPQPMQQSLQLADPQANNYNMMNSQAINQGSFNFRESSPHHQALQQQQNTQQGAQSNSFENLNKQLELITKEVMNIKKSINIGSNSNNKPQEMQIPQANNDDVFSLGGSQEQNSFLGNQPNEENPFQNISLEDSNTRLQTTLSTQDDIQKPLV